MKKHLYTISIIAALVMLLVTPWKAVGDKVGVLVNGVFYVDIGSLISGTGTGDVTGPTTPTAGSVPKWGPSGKALVDAFVLGTLTDGKWCTYTTALGVHCTSDQPASGTPTVITVADNQTDTTEFPLVVGAATGDLGPRTRSTLTYNAVTGLLSSTLFSGALNGTVGASTPEAGTFTTLGTSGKATVNNLSIGSNDNCTVSSAGDLVCKSVGVKRGPGSAAMRLQLFESWADGNQSVNIIAQPMTTTYGLYPPATVPTVGAIPYVSALTGDNGTLSWRVAVAAGQPLLSGGVNTASAFAGYYFAGTAAQTYTFPTTTATLARTDASQTFTGHNTFEGVTPTGASGNGLMVFNNAPTLIAPVLGAATGTSLLVTGRVDGKAKVLTSTAGSATTITVATHGNSCYFLNIGDSDAHSIYTLPTPDSDGGYQYCVTNYTGITTKIELLAPANVILVSDGAAGSAAGHAIMAGALGDSLCAVAVDATHYVLHTGHGTAPTLAGP